MSSHEMKVPNFQYFADVVPEPIYWGDLEQKIMGFSTKAIAGIGAKSVKDVIGKTPFDLCLLYTSPSPRDRQKSRMPSSA